MSKWGGGGFDVTYRKKLQPGAAAQELVRHSTAKVVDKVKMEDLGITEENVRHDARILGLMCHRNIVHYVG